MTVSKGGYAPPESVAELLDRYAAGERRFPDVDFNEVDLSEITLAGAIFDGSWFFFCNFDDANLRGVSFRLCNVKCTNFRRADLTGASFQLAAVEATDFADALLEGVTFDGATCYGYTIRDGDGFPNG